MIEHFEHVPREFYWLFGSLVALLAISSAVAASTW